MKEEPGRAMPGNAEMNRLTAPGSMNGDALSGGAMNDLAASGDVPMLAFENVRFQYDSEDFSIIDRLSFSVKKGEFVSVIGPSGCGKSTIFRLVNRLLMPAEGEILVNGVPVGAKSQANTGAGARKLACGYMPQQDLLFPWRTVADNVRLPLEIRGGFSKTEMDRMTAEVLESVGLTGWGQKAPKELSGGMRQRAAFARTLLTGADLLLLDEPFSALDYLTRLSMREWLLSQWEQEQKTVLFITHDVEEAIFLSTRILAVEAMPITHLRSFDVPLSHPRSVESLNAPEALALKDELIALLRKAPGGKSVSGDTVLPKSDETGITRGTSDGTGESDTSRGNASGRTGGLR